jgi:hypothetical protein
MKKILHKIRNLRKKDAPQLSTRITSETVAEHRERILAGGRRFKYPIQYARHKLVFNAIIISVVALFIVTVVGWWQLYPQQNNSEFMYRITKVLPVPVANVDGQPVLYSDYLMKYLSSLHYLKTKEQVNVKTDDGKRQIEYIKQQSMQDAIADAYALKLAKDLGVSVSDSDLELFLKNQRQSSDGEISQQTYDAVILDYYGWNPDEYRHVTKEKLLRNKVAYKIDDNALKVSQDITITLKDNSKADLKAIADSYKGKQGVDVVYGASGLVPRENQDGGLSAEAAKLDVGQITEAFKSTSGDGYFFVRLLEINDDQVSHEYIKISLTEFANKLDDITKSGKISKYISINE